MNNAIGMQNSLENIFSVFMSIIKSKFSGDIDPNKPLEAKCCIQRKMRDQVGHAKVQGKE